MPRTKNPSQPIALTIAGSDSGGGAGLQADLKTFAAIGAFGTSAVTCLTAQNPRRVSAIHAVPPSFLQEQVRAVFSELQPAACKTGMLYSESLIRALVEVWPRRKAPPLVIDPVMVATSGARLLKPSAIRTLTRDLFPLATLITPNLDEAALLLGKPISSLVELHDAALELHLRYGCAVLLKGGHLRSSPKASDVFVARGHQVVFSAPFVRGASTHGTGCTYSAAITAYLALGLGLEEAVGMAKEHITAAIGQSVHIGRHSALNPFWS
jgi:hydroxymethylpyrimidine/phosphomethylpyrimidine kinase